MPIISAPLNTSNSVSFGSMTTFGQSLTLLEPGAKIRFRTNSELGVVVSVDSATTFSFKRWRRPSRGYSRHLRRIKQARRKVAGEEREVV